MPDAVGTAGRLSDRGTGTGRDERKGQRAHVLAGGRGPLAPAQKGRVQGSAAGTADRSQAPQVVETAEERERGPAELVKGPQDDNERSTVQVRSLYSTTIGTFTSCYRQCE